MCSMSLDWLHQRDNARLLATLKHLRDLGNTVIVVEHDEEAINSADHVLGHGAGSGEHGGRVVAEGPPAEIRRTPLPDRPVSLRRARDRAAGDPPPFRQDAGVSAARSAREHLKNIDLALPVGLFVCVTGVSVRANRRSSTTRSIMPWRASSTARWTSPPRTIRSRDWNSSTRR